MCADSGSHFSHVEIDPGKARKGSVHGFDKAIGIRANIPLSGGEGGSSRNFPGSIFCLLGGGGIVAQIFRDPYSVGGGGAVAENFP